MTHSNVSATVSCNLRSIRLLLSKLLDWYTLLSDGRCIGTGLASTSRGSLGALCTGINFQLPSYALHPTLRCTHRWVHRKNLTTEMYIDMVCLRWNRWSFTSHSQMAGPASSVHTMYVHDHARSVPTIADKLVE